MTGRKGRMVLTKNGDVCYEMRNEFEDSCSVNLAEKQVSDVALNKSCDVVLNHSN